MGERFLGMEEVVGSTPISSTIFIHPDRTGYGGVPARTANTREASRRTMAGPIWKEEHSTNDTIP